MFYKLILLGFLPLCLSKSRDVTFNNVTFSGYKCPTKKFDKTIQHSNSLHDFLPRYVFGMYMVEFKDQNIPVLYEDSLTNLSLQKLVFKNCGIYEIQPGAFKRIDIIGELSLKENKIVEIKEGVFNNLEIISIDLNDNLITTIHSNAFDDVELSYVSLDNNKIARWDINWFKNSPSLSMVSMENNSITTLPNYAFKNLVGNRTYDSVIIISLSHNKIKTIEPKAFSNLTRTYSFFLDHNQLEEWDVHLLENVNVEDLWLHNNNIRYLKGDLKIFNAQYVSLNSNPFDCSYIRKIKKKARKNYKGFLELSDSRCFMEELRKSLVRIETWSTNPIK